MVDLCCTECAPYQRHIIAAVVCKSLLWDVAMQIWVADQICSCLCKQTSTHVTLLGLPKVSILVGRWQCSVLWLNAVLSFTKKPFRDPMWVCWIEWISEFYSKIYTYLSSWSTYGKVRLIFFWHMVYAMLGLVCTGCCMCRENPFVTHRLIDWEWINNLVRLPF